jgi:hypothetical protein
VKCSRIVAQVREIGEDDCGGKGELFRRLEAALKLEAMRTGEGAMSRGRHLRKLLILREPCCQVIVLVLVLAMHHNTVHKFTNTCIG